MNLKYKKYQLINPKEQILLNKSSTKDALNSHSHEFVELVYIFSGKGIHNINDKSYFISAGDLLLIRTDEYHSIYPTCEEKTTLQWINCIFLPEFINFDLSVFSPGSRFIGTFGYEMNLLFQSMLEEFSDKKQGYLEVLRSYLFIVLSKLSRVASVTTEKESYVATKKQMLVKKALDYIHLNSKEKLTLPRIASELCISTGYLSKLFKEFVNMSVIEYINNYRLEQSCKLLTHSSFTINEIALEVGFCDTKYYYKFFEKHMGTSPGEFKKNLQKKW